MSSRQHISQYLTCRVHEAERPQVKVVRRQHDAGSIQATAVSLKSVVNVLSTLPPCDTASVVLKVVGEQPRVCVGVAWGLCGSGPPISTLSSTSSGRCQGK